MRHFAVNGEKCSFRQRYTLTSLTSKHIQQNKDSKQVLSIFINALMLCILNLTSLHNECCIVILIKSVLFGQ